MRILKLIKKNKNKNNSNNNSKKKRRIPLLNKLQRNYGIFK